MTELHARTLAGHAGERGGVSNRAVCVCDQAYFCMSQ